MSTTEMLQELLQNSNPLLCCLCLNNTTEKKPIQLNDEVFFNPENYWENTILMSDMINYVLHQEDFVSTFVCNSCVTSTVHAYKFINMCTTATQRLTEFVDGVTSSLEQQDEREIKKSHRVFIATDVYSLQSMLHYDKKKALPHNKGYSKFQCALSRFKDMCYPETVPKFICDDCGIVCKTKGTIYNHITNNCYKKEKKTACNICGVLISKRCIKRHERFCGNRAAGNQTVEGTNHSTGNKPRLCNICGKSFKDLNRHLATHDPNHRFECNKCGKKYRWMHGYIQHIKSQSCSKPRKNDPTESKAYKCDLCKSQYSHLNQLRFHMKIHSDNQNDYVECKWCSKRFSSKAGLTSHAVKHTKQKEWTCDICNGQFVTKASLTYHKRTHTGEKPYKCEFCESRFINSSRRRDHMKAFHLPPIECSYCHKMIAQRGLAKHQRRHLNPKSSLYMGKEQISVLKDDNSNKLCSSKRGKVSQKKSQMTAYKKKKSLRKPLEASESDFEVIKIESEENSLST